VNESVYSEGLQREMVWLSGHLPYVQVSEVFKRIGGDELPSSTVWAVCQRQGERLTAVVEQQQSQVGVERVRWEHTQYQSEARKGVSMDGGMVLVRGEGWKELKVGVVSNLVAPEDRPLDDPDERLSDEQHYTATLSGVDDFSAALWRLAVQHGVPYAGHVAVTADGAPWIWAVATDLFPCSTQIVDWYHAAQHIDQAVQARYPNDSQATDAQRWSETLKADLFHGECFKVIRALHTAQLPDQAAYFETHQYRMHYPTFRAEGFPIGSGSTESAVKQYKHRFCGPGMRWSRHGVRRMAVIRSSVLDKSFDALWRAV
jgi:hypothetical protein